MRLHLRSGVAARTMHADMMGACAAAPPRHAAAQSATASATRVRVRVMLLRAAEFAGTCSQLRTCIISTDTRRLAAPGQGCLAAGGVLRLICYTAAQCTAPTASAAHAGKVVKKLAMGLGRRGCRTTAQRIQDVRAAPRCACGW